VHPRVDAAQACEECHAEATPAVFQQWRQSTHGLNLVKCFVCHGSTGSDFRRRPVADRCVGCHADQVSTMREASMKGKDCFTCHAPHALNPHVTSPQASAAAAVGADRLAPMVTVEGRIPPPPPAAAPPAAATPAAATQPGIAQPVPPAAAPPSAGAGAGAAPAAPGADKDLTTSKPHPPTDR
jgi:hypothetical protein